MRARRHPWNCAAGRPPPRRRMCSGQAVPASTREAIRRPRPPDQQFRAGADQALDIERPAAGVGGGEPPQQQALVDRPVGRRHQVVGQHDLLQLAAPDPVGRRGDRSGEAGNGQFGVGVADVRPGDRPAPAPLAGRPDRARTGRPDRGDEPDPSPYGRPPPAGSRRPRRRNRRTRGTTKASGPVPGLADRVGHPQAGALTSSNHSWIRAAAPGPVVVYRACTPQPTRPSPPRTKHTDPVDRGDRESSAADHGPDSGLEPELDRWSDRAEPSLPSPGGGSSARRSRAPTVVGRRKVTGPMGCDSPSPNGGPDSRSIPRRIVRHSSFCCA